MVVVFTTLLVACAAAGAGGSIATQSASPALPPLHAERDSSAESAPPLTAFVGTWQHGEPCTGIYHWMQLDLVGSRLEGRWAAYNDGWGFDSGAIIAAPAPAYGEDNQWGFTRDEIVMIRREGLLELETCQDVSDLPRYAESRCPAIDSWPREWLKLDSKTSELMFVAPNFMTHTRMKRLDISTDPPMSCPNSKRRDTP